MATHHGNTHGAHALLVLPAASGHYVRPALAWVVATWLMLTAAILFLPAPPPLPRWIRLLYRAVAGAVVLELALSQVSQWISDYRIVLSAGTFTTWLILLLAPRLWVAGRILAHRAATYVDIRPMARWRVGLVVALVLCVSGVAAWQLLRKDRTPIITRSEPPPPAVRDFRQALLDELRPVTLENCTLRRFGGPHDGGYLMCDNLIKETESAYSYGIASEDNWGCDLSKRFGVPIHQYDCFDTTEPTCGCRC